MKAFLCVLFVFIGFSAFAEEYNNNNLSAEVSIFFPEVNISGIGEHSFDPAFDLSLKFEHYFNNYLGYNAKIGV